LDKIGKKAVYLQSYSIAKARDASNGYSYAPICLFIELWRKATNLFLKFKTIQVNWGYF
jgi:hypothetical protein